MTSEPGIFFFFFFDFLKKMGRSGDGNEAFYWDGLIAPCKGIQDSLGLWIDLRNEFRIPVTGLRLLFLVELGFRILSLTGIRIPRVVFRIPKRRIPDFKATIFWIAESGFPYMGRFTMSVGLNGV